MKLKVSLFFDSVALQRPWSFDLESQSLSGTDVSLLGIANGLDAMDDFEVLVYATSLPEKNQNRVRLVGSLEEAVCAAEAQGDDYLIFVASSGDEQEIIFNRCKPRSLKLIAWAQCSPSFRWMSAACKAAAFYRLIAVSNVQRAYMAHHPLYKRTVVIPNFLDLKNWERTLVEQKAVVTYVGALKFTKGFHHLADVWREIHATHPEWRLLVCGSPGLYGKTGQLGPEALAEREFEARILSPLGGSRDAARGLGVDFVGSLPKAALRDAMSASKIVVVNPNNTNSIETFCVSAVEAMALGIPVVGGAAGGLLEVVGHRRSGLLARNEKELKAAIEELMDKPHLAAQLGSAGRARVESMFQKSSAMARWVALLKGYPLATDTLPLFKFQIPGFYIRTLIRCALPVAAIASLRDGLRRARQALRKN